MGDFYGESGELGVLGDDAMISCKDEGVTFFELRFRIFVPCGDPEGDFFESPEGSLRFEEIVLVEAGLIFCVVVRVCVEGLIDEGAYGVEGCVLGGHEFWL
jgi:hypothetical protein